MISLLIWLVVVCFVIWAAYAIVGAFKIPDPWRTLLFIAIGLVVLMILLNAIGGGGGTIRLPSLTG